MGIARRGGEEESSARGGQRLEGRWRIFRGQHLEGRWRRVRGSAGTKLDGGLLMARCIGKVQGIGSAGCAAVDFLASNRGRWEG